MSVPSGSASCSGSVKPRVQAQRFEIVVFVVVSCRTRWSHTHRHTNTSECCLRPSTAMSGIDSSRKEPSMIRCWPKGCSANFYSLLLLVRGLVVVFFFVRAVSLKISALRQLPPVWEDRFQKLPVIAKRKGTTFTATACLIPERFRRRRFLNLFFFARQEKKCPRSSCLFRSFCPKGPMISTSVSRGLKIQKIFRFRSGANAALRRRPREDHTRGQFWQQFRNGRLTRIYTSCATIIVTRTNAHTYTHSHTHTRTHRRPKKRRKRKRLLFGSRAID